MSLRAFFAVIACSFASIASATVFNLKVVTDASPDYSDMESMVRSITSKWQTTEQKCWAMFYWNHIARRQTAPMMLHGMALTDPIRQFNDYGYTMCSTISGINCSIWDAMGLKAKYWDISNHTVAEVEYDGRWHMYDNSLSALYTLCDGKTLAGVADIGKAGACATSGGKKLTDGVIGPAYPGGTAPASALCWNKGQKPQITVDLGEARTCGAFRIQVGAGWPWWDSLKGKVKDKVEVLTSTDGETYQSHGFVNLNLRWKDLPANHMWPDEEVIAAHNFELIPPTPVTARYARYNITPERTLTVSEIEVLESIRYEPFDLRVTLPDGQVAAR